ncbi:siderophore-iron reductase FhuF [Falsiroseomonas sp. HC035]|uniref:siderophore-iron reductase FhuF n=1 Tax=Falsiroseomonas sp. HC035 TaxID=3390999 RepID=UPI003D31353A
MKGFPLLRGDQAPLVESLVPLPAPGALPASLLLQAGGGATLLAAAWRHRPEVDPRALASLWSRWYFAKLIPPVLLCGVADGRSLPLNLAETAVLLGPEGLPRSIALPHAGRVEAEACPFRRFAPLVRHHVAAVVEALSAETRLAPRILWNNAGVYADWAVRRMVDAGLPHARASLALVQAPDCPDGTPNPLHAPVCEPESRDGIRWRRHCCLLFRLPGQDCCRACPRLRKNRAPGVDDNARQSH